MERFYDKTKEIEDGCIIWTAALRGKTGYGAFRYKGKVIDSHRFAFFLKNGDIPEGLLVCHTCDNRRCVNPDHLFLGSNKDNYDDAIKKGRMIKPMRQNKHPSVAEYKRGCRCDKCVESKRIKGRIYQKIWRKNQKKK